MDNAQRKNLIMVVVVVLLLVGAAVAMFRDSLFGGSSGGPAIDQNTVAQVGNAVGATDGKPEPDSPNPPPRGSGKLGGKK